MPLSFTLYQRPVHPELFKIYREFDFSTKRFNVTVWVTNHCHVLTISVESIHITELIARPGQPLPAGALLAKFQLPCEKRHTHIFGNNLKYHCQFDINRSACLKKQHEELKQRCGKKSKLINFPGLSTDTGPAFTFIESYSSDDELKIQTQHSRPGLDGLITTSTTVDLSEIG